MESFVVGFKNSPGSTKVVAVSKRPGKFEEVRNFGTAKIDSDVARLYSARH